MSHLMTKVIRNRDEWSWYSQLRYYLNGSGCSVKLGDAVVNYTFEYQGNYPRLVHTALTDKCYLNLIQAIHFGFGG